MVLCVPKLCASLALLPSPKWISLRSLCFPCLLSPDLCHLPFSDQLPGRIACTLCLFSSLYNLMELLPEKPWIALNHQSQWSPPHRATWYRQLPHVSWNFLLASLLRRGNSVFPPTSLTANLTASWLSLSVPGPWNVALSQVPSSVNLFSLVLLISFSSLTYTLLSPWPSSQNVLCSLLPGRSTSFSTSLYSVPSQHRQTCVLTQ